MSVILTNPGRRPFVTTLDHDVACAHDGVCHCKVSHRAGRDGKPEVVRLPRTIRIDSGKSLEIESSALLLSSVSRAIKDGRILKEIVVSKKPEVTEGSPMAPVTKKAKK